MEWKVYSRGFIRLKKQKRHGKQIIFKYVQIKPYVESTFFWKDINKPNSSTHFIYENHWYY